MRHATRDCFVSAMPWEWQDCYDVWNMLKEHTIILNILYKVAFKMNNLKWDSSRPSSFKLYRASCRPHIEIRAVSSFMPWAQSRLTGLTTHCMVLLCHDFFLYGLIGRWQGIPQDIWILQSRALAQPGVSHFVSGPWHRSAKDTLKTCHTWQSKSLTTGAVAKKNAASLEIAA